MATIGPSQIVTTGKYTDVRRASRRGEIEPRFTPKLLDFSRFLQYLESTALVQEPAYSPDSRLRDAWLQKVRYAETLMVGVINAVTLIDANRGWQLTGGRNTVRKWSDRLHASANGNGWRHFIKKASLSYWTTDMGAVIGVRRPWPFAAGRSVDDIQPAPAQTFENIDSALCYLTNGLASPEELGYQVPYRLMYNSRPIFDWDYFRVTSMPSDVESYLDLGYCALSRALEFVKLMFAVWRHDSEQLGAKMPKGLLILNNIGEEQWLQSMEARGDNLTALEREVYGGVQVLSNAGPGTEADAKLVALSSLPTGWDQETMTYLLMYGYANAFGYDAREFMPVSQGQLGTGRETQVQAEKASSKGQMDFALGFQERLQDEIPDTLHFEFEERDDAGAAAAAEVKKAQAQAIAELSKMRETSSPVLSNDEIRQLLAQDGLIPDEWTAQEETIMVTDEEPDAQAQDEESGDLPATGQPADSEPGAGAPDVSPAERRRRAELFRAAAAGRQRGLNQLRQRLLGLPQVRQACERDWNSPIVRLEVRYVDGRREEIERVLWASGDEALRRRSYPVYTGPGLTITREDVAKAIGDSM